jgi:hypothetical protein
MPKVSKWKAQHKECQEAVERVAATHRAEIEQLAAERDRLVRALYMVGDVERLAQCPCCLAERTNGEWHADDCALGAGVERSVSER